MAPKPDEKTQLNAQQEGRLQLAIQAIKNGHIASIRSAAKAFEVPRSTLQDRIKGTEYVHERHQPMSKLTNSEEESLERWILSLDKRGVAPRADMVRDMANLLIAKRGDTTDATPPSTVGKNWVANYIQRRPNIQLRRSRKYDYQRAKCENKKLIKDWFNQVQDAIIEYGISDEDIWNFDETGFAMGVASTLWVVSRSDHIGRRKMLQAGNREWVTTIESMNCNGAIPPTVILKGKTINTAWFNTIPYGWRLEVSPKRWTNDEIGLQWVADHFIPLICGIKRELWQLLIMDGHGSHITAKFDDIYMENNVLLIVMPAHSSHLLQSLDVGIFSVIK